MIYSFITVLAVFVCNFAQVFGVVYTERPKDFTPVVEVSACFIENNGKFLFLHIQDGKSQGNTWGIPGGKLEKNESALHAAIREVQEETGIKLIPDNVKHIQTVYITNTVRNKVSYIYHMFSAPYDGNIAVTIAPKEHKGFTWVTLHDALKMELMDDEAPCIELAFPETAPALANKS